MRRSPLKIDKTAPTTTVINPISPDSGWFVTSGIPVAFEATDAGSGIAATYYTIDGGRPADLRRAVHRRPLHRHPHHHLLERRPGRQRGGPRHDQHVAVKVDTIAPTITGSQTPAANGFGWNNTDVKVTFTCADADSGLDGIAGCGPDQTVANEGADQSVHGDAQDVAGNKSSRDGRRDQHRQDRAVAERRADRRLQRRRAGTAATCPSPGPGRTGCRASTRRPSPANSTITGEGRNLGASVNDLRQGRQRGHRRRSPASRSTALRSRSTPRAARRQERRRLVPGRRHGRLHLHRPGPGRRHRRLRGGRLPERRRCSPATVPTRASPARAAKDVAGNASAARR